MANYHVHYIQPGGSVRTKVFSGAPSPLVMAGHGRQDEMFFTRFFPSKGRWRLFRAQLVRRMCPPKGTYNIFEVYNTPEFVAEFPTDDAAIVYATLMC